MMSQDLHGKKVVEFFYKYPLLTLFLFYRQMIKAINCLHLMDINLKDLKQFDVIGIDEGQFFDDVSISKFFKSIFKRAPLFIRLKNSHILKIQIYEPKFLQFVNHLMID